MYEEIDIIVNENECEEDENEAAESVHTDPENIAFETDDDYDYPNSLRNEYEEEETEEFDDIAESAHTDPGNIDFEAGGVDTLDSCDYPNSLRNDRSFDNPAATYTIVQHEFVKVASWTKLWVPEEKMMYRVYKRHKNGDTWRCITLDCGARITVCSDGSCVRYNDSPEHSHIDHEYNYQRLVCRRHLYESAANSTKVCGGAVVKASDIIKQARVE